MASRAPDFRLYATTLLAVIGALLNMFNLLATFLQQLKSRGLQSVSLIICSISLANVVMHVSTSSVLAWVQSGVQCRQELPLSFSATTYVWFSSSCVSFWSIAWLSVLYCVKVVRVSSELLRTIKNNISSIINVTLLLTIMTSAVMFAPFFTLQFDRETHYTNASENATCIGKIVLSAWVNAEVYVLVFSCYLALLPLLVMLPSSLGLVVHLHRHTMSMMKKNTGVHSVEPYLLICRVTVALVLVYFTTLIIISFYFFYTLYVGHLQTDMLNYGFSFYCISSAILLTVSNKYLRANIHALFCNKKK